MARIGFFSSTRRCIGGIVALIGIIMILPSIGIFLVADAIYGKPVLDSTTQISLTGTPTIVVINSTFKAGNDYDIHMKYVVGSVAHDPPTSSFTVNMVAVSSSPSQISVDSKTTSDSQFNQTTTYSFDKLEFPEDLTSDVVLTFTFVVVSKQDISSIAFTIEIYENPNRPLVNTLNRVATILLIPGIIVIVIGACISGPSNSRRSGRSTGSSSGMRFKRA